MKHYGAVLTGDSNIVDGGESSLLVIGTSTTNDDTLVIHNNNTTTGATDAAADGSVGGLVLVPSVAGRGETHVIGADGREVEIDGNFGSINSTTARVPVKGINAAGNDIFVNSIITEVHATGLNYDATADGATTSTMSNADGIQIAGNVAITSSGNLTVAGNTTMTGNLTVQGNTVFHTSTVSQYEDSFIELNVAQDKTAPATSGTGGILVEHTYDAGGGNELFGGLRFNGAANSNVGQWEYNLAADINGGATASGTATGAWIPFAAGTLTGVRNGNGITVSESATEDGITGTAAEPLVSVNLTGAFPTETAASQGGLAFTNVGTTNGDTSIGIAQGGVDAGMLDVTAAASAALDNFLLSYNHAAGNFTWVAPGGTGSINRAVITGTKLMLTTSVVIPRTSVAGTGVGQTATGIGEGEQNLTVTVYEAVTDGFSEILPESIVISSASGTEGQVTIEFGATAADLDYKIVILG